MAYSSKKVFLYFFLIIYIRSHVDRHNLLTAHTIIYVFKIVVIVSVLI